MLDSQLLSLTACREENSPVEMLFSLEKSAGSEKIFSLSAHKLHRGKEASKTAVVTIFQSSQRILGFQVSPDGQNIVAITKESFRIGTLERRKDGPLNGINYDWREISTPKQILCFGTRTQAIKKSHKKDSKIKQTLSQQQLDVVVGSVSGALYVYEDVLNTILRMEKAKNQTYNAADMEPRILHWHREAVGAVKWSLDGKVFLPYFL